MIWRKQRGFGTFDTNSRLFMTVAVVVGLCAVLASLASARVCNFDDLPVVPSGQLEIIPEGYCGTIWFGEGGPAVPYFSKSFSDQFGTYAAHSQPNATFTETGQFAFNPQSPEVFNGFWATLNPKAWQAPCYIHPSPGGRLVSAIDPAGRKLLFKYGANGLISSITDPIGRQVNYRYDANSNLVGATDPSGFTTHYTYDDSHRLLTITDRNGRVATNTYDSSNRVVLQRDRAGRTLSFAYNADTTSITDGNGHVDSQTYTGNRLTSRTVGAGTASAATWTFAYDRAGDRISETDPNGHLIHITYDSRSNPLKITDQLGRTTTMTYDGKNDLTSQTDQLGTK